MKIYEVTINMPGHYGGDLSSDERDRRCADDRLWLNNVLAGVGVNPIDFGRSMTISVLVDAAQTAQLVCLMPHEYNKIHVARVEERFDSGSEYSQLESMLIRLQTVAATIEARADLSGGFLGDHYNEHAKSPIPGNHLAEFNELMLMENSCTDAVQEAIDAGWRIVAVCPQPSRRPDYVLGRYVPKPDYEKHKFRRRSSALRPYEVGINTEPQEPQAPAPF